VIRIVTLHCFWRQDKAHYKFFITSQKKDSDNIRDVNRKIALSFAAFSFSVAIINILLVQVMSADFTTTYGHTPLYVSAKCVELNTTKSLVESLEATNL